MQDFLCRSALYMPASNQRVLGKGPTLAADAIIIDLEDSVAPAQKELARAQALDALNTLDYGDRLRVLRINAADSPWFVGDMELLANVTVDAVVLPKVESTEELQQLNDALNAFDAAGKINIWAMMETPRAVVNANAIAAFSENCIRLQTLCIGNNDMARVAGMQVSSDRTLLIPWLMTLLAAVKAYGLNILDGVYNDFGDAHGFMNECEQGAAMGMDGKTLIHPSQIAPANQAFAPSDDAVQQAKAIIHAFAQPENLHAGALQIHGRMIERLHLGMAEQTLARYEYIQQKH